MKRLAYKNTTYRICPKCGIEVKARGFASHLRNTHGAREVVKVVNSSERVVKGKTVVDTVVTKRVSRLVSSKISDTVCWHCGSEMDMHDSRTPHYLVLRKSGWCPKCDKVMASSKDYYSRYSR